MKRYIVVALAALALAACEKNPTDEPFKGTFKVSGTVEKGPFVQGSTINMQTMDDKLHPTGKTFMENIKDDAGTFDFGSLEFDTPYAKITATGYFFNEVTGELSKGMINLNALVDLSDKSSVNVNLLTHLKSQRVQKLIEEGNTFKAAASQAQAELMGAFGLQKYAGKDVSQFSITSGTDEAAALIAVSSIIQVDRSEASMTEFISKLTNEFGTNGVFSDATKQTIANSTQSLIGKLDIISRNIVGRYETLGKTVSVKPLKYYFDWDGNGSAGGEIAPEGSSVSLDKTVINAPSEGGRFAITVTSPVPVYINGAGSGNNPSTGVVSPDIINIYDVDAGYNQNVHCSVSNNVITIEVDASKSRAESHSEFVIVDYLDTQLATFSVNQAANPNAPVPGLSHDGEMLVGNMMYYIARAMTTIDQLERMYAHNSSFGNFSAPMNASDSRIYQTWSGMYAAMRQINTLRELDASKLNLYGPFLDFYAAICYRLMTHVWGDVVYFMQNPSTNVTSYPRTNVGTIQDDLITRLTAALESTDDKSYFGCDLSARDLFFIPRNFVKVMLGYLYMDKGQYQEANAYLQEVCASDYYSLDEGPSDAIVLEGNNTPYMFGLRRETSTKAVIDQSSVVVIYSYPEILLSLAECRMKLGDQDGALAFVNQVGLAKGWDGQRTDKSKILDYILELRKQEKYPYHFSFLKRNNLAQSELGITNSNYLLLPIPTQEIIYNSGMTQNPGY
jgi:hypothetical protein